LEFNQVLVAIYYHEISLALALPLNGKWVSYGC